jgi:hypothetical protein
MIRSIHGWLAASLLIVVASPAFADEKEVATVLDKAIKALGGEEKLAKAGTASWETKGTIIFGDNESTITTKTTVQGLDRHRAEFDGEFGGNPVKGVTVLDGKKGWRKFNENTQDLEDEALANERQRAYTQAATMLILPLKVETAPDGKLDGKPTSVLKVTGPDGKDFTIGFDKETGLPVKVTATTRGFQGGDFLQETYYSDYKDFGGVKRATKIETRRDGQPFLKSEVVGYRVVDKPEADAFAEPK